MVVSCSAYGCAYRFSKEKGIGIFRFPSDKIKRKKWVTAIKRVNLDGTSWVPSTSSRICGQHFQTGRPQADVNHPDYVPNVFTYKPSCSTAGKYERRKKSSQKRGKQINLISGVQEVGCSSSTNELFASSSSQSERVSHGSISTESCCGSNGNSGDCDALINEIEKLKLLLKMRDSEIVSLRKERDMWKEKASASHGEIHDIVQDENKLVYYTGLPNMAVFKWLLDVVKNEEGNHQKFQLPLAHQLLIVLVRIKLNLQITDIAYRFAVSRTTIYRIFEAWFPMLSGKLKSLITWPSQSTIRKHLPECFKHSKFSNTVCIIDCTEVFIQKPGNHVAREQCFSKYKHHYTIKFLVGITPSGHISFLSKVWGGRASDKHITIKSGILDKISPGDVVLADRGFTLSDQFARLGATLIIPSFKRSRKQLPMHELIHSENISNVRIHVERVIKQIKRFSILQSVMPITCLKYADSIITLCGALSNISSSII